MKKYLLSIIALALILTVGASAYGAENTFQTSLDVIADDPVAPSVPLNLLASTLSSTVINLTWDASTDNVGVTGYRIFRDGFIIASTTGIFYQDSGLVASTTYDYNVEAYDYQLNYSGQSLTSSTTTLPTPVIVVPPTPTTTPSTGSRSGSVPQNQNIAQEILANVSNVRATPYENSIALTWNNPTSAIFAGVRIVRSERFFPRDIFDGEVVYEGGSEGFEDRDVVSEKTYYYTIFSKDENGGYSSGALTQARIGGGRVVDPLESVVYLTHVDPIIEALTLFDFDFIQSTKKLAVIGDAIAINGGENLTVSLDYDKVPEILKTIVITLSDPADPSLKFSFLLRVNKTKSAYEATIGPLGKSGRYNISITILDYKNQGLKKIQGNLHSLAFSAGTTIANNFGGINMKKVSLYLLILLAAVLLISFIARKKKEKEFEPVS
ncbi:MAG: hypothetical protein V4697_01315 [Patescibacteria group bacterium]